MGNIVEPILADCGLYNRHFEDTKDIEEEILRVKLL